MTGVWANANPDLLRRTVNERQRQVEPYLFA
jgi:hypothetical protein